MKSDIDKTLYWKRCGLSPKQEENQAILEIIEAEKISRIRMTLTLRRILKLGREETEKQLKNLPAQFGPFPLPQTFALVQSLQEDMQGHDKIHGKIRLSILGVDQQEIEKIASIPEVPSTLLDFLSYAPSRRVRQQVSQNPNTSLTRLLQLTLEFPKEVLQNPGFLKQMFNSPELFQSLTAFQLTFLSHPNVPISLLEGAVEHKEFAVKKLVLQHPNCPSELLSQFATEGDEFLEVVRKNPNCPQNLLPASNSPLPRKTKSQTAKPALLPTPHSPLQEKAKRQTTTSPDSASGSVDNLLFDADPLVRQVALTHVDCPQDTVEFLWRAGASENLKDILEKRRDPFFLLSELQTLVEKGDFGRQLTAQHPLCPPEMLQKLALDPSPEVRKAVATRKNCSVELLFILASDTNKFVHANVAKHANCSQVLLKALALDSENFVKRRLLQNPSISGELLHMVTISLPEDDARFAAKNPNCLAKTLQVLLKNPKEKLAVAAHPNCPKEVLQTLAKDRDKHVRFTSISNRSFPKLELETLAFSKDTFVKQGVVANPVCSSIVLQALDSDPDPIVKHSIAAHPNCRLSTLAKLSQDEKVSIRCEVARNPYISLSLLEQLAKDPELEVRTEVAGNEATPVEVLDQLSKEEELQHIILKNPNFPAEKLAAFLVKSPKLRIVIAKYPDCPWEILGQLLQDSDKFVRQAAREHPTYRRKGPIKTIKP